MEATDRLDSEHIDAAAQYAADQLGLVGHVKVRLAPGDMTEYRIAIVAPSDEWAYGDVRPGKYYWVTLCAGFGAGYEWHGGAIDGGYAAEKWTNPDSAKGTRAWTGEVVALFLTAVAGAMRANAVELAGP